MTLAVDASSPALKNSAFLGTQSASFTSNTFSPPASSTLVVLIYAQQSFNNAWNTTTITDSLGSHLTWTLASTQADISVAAADTLVAIAWAQCPSSQTNMTVTATCSVASGQTVTSMCVQPVVFTGAATSPIGTVAKGFSTATSLTETVVPSGSNSAVLAGTYNAGSGTALTAGSNTFFNGSVVQGTSYVASSWFGTSGGPTLTSSSATQNITQPASPRTNWVAFEVLAASVAVRPAPIRMVRQAVARAANW